MTIGCSISIVLGVIVSIGGLIYGVCLIKDYEVGGGITTIFVSEILAAVLIIAPFVYMNTEVGARALKDQKSNFNGGIERVVTVYDVNGEVIKQYEGKFDVETSNIDGASYILFDDENEKRHIVYYTTGTVTIDEK